MIPVMWHDVHSHPHQLPDPETALRRAQRAGVSLCVAATERPSELRHVLKLAELFPEMVIPAAGLHPAAPAMLDDQTVQQELSLLDEYAREIRLVSEIGLDYKYAQSSDEKSRQKKILEKQFEIAVRHKLPVQLHSRRAQRAAMEAAISFAENTGLPALLHWFTASRKLIRIVNERPRVFISVGPSVLYSEETQKVVKEVKIEKILVETDCPVPIGGNPNEPAKAAEVAKALSKLFGLAEADLSQQLEKNLNEFLNPNP